MLKFFSRRKPKGPRVEQPDYRTKDGEGYGSRSGSKGGQKYRPNKNVIACRIILLDGTDLSLDLPVMSDPLSVFTIFWDVHK